MGFVSFPLKRLVSKAALNLLHITGLALAIGVVVAVPMFADGAGRSLVAEEIATRTRTLNQPPFSVRLYTTPSSRLPMGLNEANYMRDWLADALQRQVGLPITDIYAQYESPSLQLRPKPGDTRYGEDEQTSVRAVVVPDLERHIEVLEGSPFGATSAENDLLAWVAKSYADELGLRVGDRFDLVYLLAGTMSPVQVRVQGVFTQGNPQARFWYRQAESLFRGALFVSAEQYQAHIAPLARQGTGYDFWYLVFDDGRMNLDHADRYVEALQTVERDFAKRTLNGKMDFSPTAEMLRGQLRKRVLSTILFGFSLPLLCILGLFIISIAGIVARSQVRETAMLLSRGGERSQVALWTAVEALVLFLLAVGPGLFIGLAMARLLSASRGFMLYGGNAPVQPHLGTARWTTITLVGLFGLVTRVVPAWPEARLTLVSQEQRLARHRAMFTAARFLAMLLLAGTAAYAYRQLRQLGTLFIGTWQGEGKGILDPLALLAPALFLFSTPLLLTELFSLFSRVLLFIFRLSSSGSIYLGFLHLGREGGQYRLPMYLLILTLTVGIFYGSVARSADIWMVERRRYEVGADLTFEPGALWEETAAEGASSSGSAFVLPSEDYAQVAGVADVTQVVQLPARVAVKENSPQLRLMAIDCYRFPQVAFYRPDFSDAPLQELMNALASKPNGLLVPSDFDERYELGGLSKIPLRLRLGEEVVTLEFDVVGTFDHFPTMLEDEPVVVANSSYLDQQIGMVFNHRVWLRLQPGASGKSVLKSLDQLAVSPKLVRDANALIASDQARVERIGIFGMLTICFLAAAVFSTMGRVVYSLSSLVVRSNRFALLQAIGMTRNQVLTMISVEDLLMVLYGLGGGLLLGLLASRYYVPFYAVTERASLPIPPFLAHIDWSSALQMAVAMAAVLMVVQAVVLLYVRRSKIFELLRAGIRQ